MGVPPFYLNLSHNSLISEVVVGSGKDGLAEIQFTDVHEFSFTPGFPYVNILRKWWNIWWASFKSLHPQIKTTIYQYNPPKVCFLFLCRLPSQRSSSSSEWTGVCEGGAEDGFFNFSLTGLYFRNYSRWKTPTLLRTFLIGLTEISLRETRLEIVISSGLEGETFYSVSTNPFL